MLPPHSNLARVLVRRPQSTVLVTSNRSKSASLLCLGARAMGYPVQAYAFQGYWEDIGTIEAFYDANLALVKTDGTANFR